MEAKKGGGGGDEIKLLGPISTSYVALYGPKTVRQNQNGCIQLEDLVKSRYAYLLSTM